MRAHAVLATGILLLFGGLITALIKEKSVMQTATGRSLCRTYLLFLVFALAVSVLLCLAGLINKWLSVDAYRVLFDFFTIGLLGVFFSGLILVIRRRGFVMSYALSLCGAFLAFGEFLGV
jgi:formate hydrogenlyase subunit 3/multisubunit Na+/H+ antiporter MnhD subunit